MAMRAACSRSSGAEPPAQSDRASPVLTATCRCNCSMPCDSSMPYGRASASASRRATARAWSGACTPSSRTTNSSLPRRAADGPMTPSFGRSACVRRCAIRRSRASPTAAPCATLTPLKRSALMYSTATGRAGLAWRAAARRSSTATRLGKAVSSSTRAASRRRESSRWCSRWSAAVTSLRLAIRCSSSSRCRSSARMRWPSGQARRRLSQTTVPGAASALARRWRKSGSTCASASNRLPRSPPGTSGSRHWAAIGLIITTSPSSVVCNRPMGARYKNWTRAS